VDISPTVPKITAFRVGRFAVVNAEWACFMAAGGYENERWWETEDGRRWRRARVRLSLCSGWCHSWDLPQTDDLGCHCPGPVARGCRRCPRFAASATMVN